MRILNGIAFMFLGLKFLLIYGYEHFCDKYFSDCKKVVYRIVMQDKILKVINFKKSSKSVKIFFLKIFRLYGSYIGS